MQELNQTQIAQRLDLLTELSVELGSRHDTDSLLERILMVAKSMTAADGGTLYRPSDDKQQLNFHISVNDTLNIRQGGKLGEPINIPAVPLYDAAGAKNLSSVAAYAANLGQSVNIEDVYQADEFNFSGMRMFDQHYRYHSQSFLTVPMNDHEGELVGVLQLINAKDPDTGAICAFTPTDQRFIEALAAQAGVAITNQRLIAQLEELLEALVNLINIGIDEKSPYTGRHCQFVPELTMMLAEAVHNTDSGPLAGFRMNDGDRQGAVAGGSAARLRQDHHARCTWSTRPPSWRPSSTASTRSIRASRYCCAMPSWRPCGASSTCWRRAATRRRPAKPSTPNWPTPSAPAYRA